VLGYGEKYSSVRGEFAMKDQSAAHSVASKLYWDTPELIDLGVGLEIVELAPPGNANDGITNQAAS
jgi:hypothetical protein